MTRNPKSPAKLKRVETRKVAREENVSKFINSIHWNDEQKEALKLIRTMGIIVVTGKAGSGKSILSIKGALDLLNADNSTYEKIIITRPMVATEDIGYLPGDLLAKVSPYLQPFEEFFSKLGTHGKYTVEEMTKTERLEVAPVAFMRGRNTDNCIVLVDEAQNLNVAQVKLILTRFGKNTKMIITADENQQDVKGKSGLDWLLKISQHPKMLSYISHINLVKSERSPFVDALLSIDEEELK